MNFYRDRDGDIWKVTPDMNKGFGHLYFIDEKEWDMQPTYMYDSHKPYTLISKEEAFIEIL